MIFMVKNTDSINKIIDYLKKLKVAKISKMFFRSYRCLPNCGGCCPKFTLDYFEGERLKKLYPMAYKRLEKRVVKHNGADVVVYSDLQKDNSTRWCINLGVDGLCKIHEANPFSCQFELNKVWGTQEKAFIQKRLFGRGWNFKRVDGGRGALGKPPLKTKNFRSVSGLSSAPTSSKALTCTSEPIFCGRI